MKNYIPPNLPTHENANKNLLKKLPSRWQKKAAIFACAGFVGMVALAGCNNNAPHHEDNLPPRNTPIRVTPSPLPIYPTPPPETDEEIRARIEAATEAFENIRTRLETAEITVVRRERMLHGGGAGGGGAPPIYVAHFTEQEVWGFFRTKLEAEGLYFNIESTSDFGYELDLFDARNRVGILFAGTQGIDSRSIWRDWQAFERQYNDIIVGVFFNHEEEMTTYSLELWDWEQEWFDERGYFDDELNHLFYWEEYGVALEEFRVERAEESRQALINNLTEQVQNFITRLQQEGVL
jgi:hypothetical protein